VDWIERITGQRRPSPAELVAPGQWRYCGERRISIGEAEAQSGDVLMPGSDGRCRVPNAGPVRCDPRCIADEDALRSLRLVGGRLRAMARDDWESWTAETPLLPALDEALEETALERTIAMKLGYLECACKQPRTHLRLEEERLLVGRCKRPSPKAPNVLAARSEDWERRTLWGVRPRRVLGIVRDDLYDIYENRVAVALIDNLDVALLRRLRSVRRAVELLKQRENYQHLLDGSHNYRRAERILELWGEALEDSGRLDHALAVYRRIMALRRRVLALKDTLLYRKIGGLRGQRLHLRMTNVLVHDEVYRRVAELWVAWEDHIRSLSADPQSRWQQEQDAAEGFEQFVFLVVVRALESLGFSPPDQACASTDASDGEWKLVGPAGEIRLRRDDSGVSVSSEYADEPLRFVSVPAMLEASTTLDEWIRTLRAPSVVIVALPADEPRLAPEKRVWLRHAVGELPEKPVFVTASPWDLESVEKVARVIRWYAWSALFDSYPLRVALPPNWTPPTPVPCWSRETNRLLVVSRPPAEHERKWADLADRIAAAERAKDDAKEKLDACDRKDHREARKRLRLKAELDRAESEHDATLTAAEAIRNAIDAVDLLRNCPVCRAQASDRAFEHDNELPLFHCTCSECGATWGRRTCDACRQPFAFLTFPGNEPSEDLLDADRRYGADVLALPLDDDVYACPRCGARSDGEEPCHSDNQDASEQAKGM